MPIIYAYSLADSFAGVRSLQTDGVNPSGNSAPEGVGDSITLRNGWGRFTITPNTIPFGGGIRSELTGPDEVVPSTRLYRWESVLEDFEYDTESFVIMQMHANHPGTAYAEEILIRCDGKHMWLALPIVTPPGQGLVSNAVAFYPVRNGESYLHALQVKWDKNGNGFIIWMVNGCVVYNNTRIGTEYNYPTGPYLKLGIYTGGAHSNPWIRRTQYVRNVIVSEETGENSWLDLVGRTPKPRSFSITY